LRASAREVLRAIIKDPLQFRTNNQCVQDRAKRTERRYIRDQIVHLRPAVGRLSKSVLVMPEAVGANPLLVDEPAWRIDVDDLGQPSEGDA